MKSDILCEDCFNVLPRLESGSFDTVIMCLWSNPSQQALDELAHHAIRISRGSVIIQTVADDEFYILRQHVAFSKYSKEKLVWAKHQHTNPLSVYNRPMDCTEDILVIRKPNSFFTPATTTGTPYTGFVSKNGATIGEKSGSKQSRHRDNPAGERCVGNLLVGRSDRFTKSKYGLQDNPQPLWLFEQLLYCYTPPSGSVLEIGAGSGTGKIAAHNLGLDYQGIEKNFHSVCIAEKRFSEEAAKTPLTSPKEYISKIVETNIFHHLNGFAPKVAGIYVKQTEFAQLRKLRESKGRDESSNSHLTGKSFSAIMHVG